MQVIKYKWMDRDGSLSPHMLVGDRILPLMGETFSMKIGKKKCIGSFQKGKHMKCSNETESSQWFCYKCSIADDYCMCIRCTGEKCINLKQRNACEKNNYYIYLAAFDNMLKVGISLDRRIMERLIEQGADMGAKIANVQDGLIVRQLEQKIKNSIGVVDRIRGKQKQQMIFGSPNKASENINNAVMKLRANGISFFQNPEIYDLRKHYKLENVPYHPRAAEVIENETIEGTCVAAKGNIMILCNKDEFFSINSHDLIGREIDMLDGQPVSKLIKII